MKKYLVPYNIIIKIPYQGSFVSLRVKEENQLDVLAFFILDAIHRINATEEEISRSTLLGNETISLELKELEKQNLIMIEDEKISLTENAIKLWEINSIPKSVNRYFIGKTVKLNLIDKKIIEGEECIDDTGNVINLISKYTIDDYSIEDECIQNLFFEKISFQKDNSKRYFDSIKDCWYVDFNPNDKPLYRSMIINQIPCYTEAISNEPDSLVAKGIFIQKTYSCDGKEYNLFFDTVSGEVFFNFHKNEGKPKYVLKLPQIHNITAEMENNLLSVVRKQYQVPDNLEVVLKTSRDIEYYINFQLSDLIGD